MRSEAVSWNDWSVNPPPPVVDTDKWHVQIAPDEVKVVSLEQLDDLFRLSIVDSETQVWQTGMIEWQPLRVIAGLDEPAPQPRRAPPKPPTRTVVMAPQPAQQAVRPVAPAPRSASPSMRPAAPAARPVSLAPASFYPEPVQATQSAYPAQGAYAAPLAFAATAPVMNSVRPLVVSHAPPAARGGGGFGRFLVGVALLAGVSVTAYRNDFVRDAAHQAHQDALYARLESALGGPAFGTLRALEQSAAAQPSLDAAAIDTSPIRTAISATAEAAPAAAPSAPAPTLGTTTPPVVSLESLAPEQKGQAAAKIQAAAAPPVNPTPVHAAASFVQPKPAATPAPAKTPAARPAAPAKAAVEKPAPVAQKPASEMTERERLNAAIGQSMMESTLPKSKGKKTKSKGNSEYDPLNPTL